MNAKDKARNVKNGTQSSSDSAQETVGNRATQCGGKVGNSGVDIAQQMGEKLGNQMTGQIMYHAMKTVESNLSTGNYGELFGQFLNSFERGFDATLQQNNLLMQEDLDPKYALPSSTHLGNSQNSLLEASPVTIAVETIN